MQDLIAQAAAMLFVVAAFVRACACAALVQAITKLAKQLPTQDIKSITSRCTSPPRRIVRAQEGHLQIAIRMELAFAENWTGKDFGRPPQ